jgi:hypothetical protein
VHNLVDGSAMYHSTGLRLEVPPWSEEGSDTPVLLACIFFSSMLFVDVAVLYAINTIQSLVPLCSAQVMPVVMVHIVIGCIALVSYVLEYILETKVVLGDVLIMRFVQSLLTSPLLWYIFCKLFTHCEKRDMRILYAFTVATQVFGFGLVSSASPSMDIFSWCCFTGCFRSMFRTVYRLPLLHDSIVMGQWCRLSWFALWSGYPCVMMARRLGLVSVWFEQILLWPILDIMLKTVTCTACILLRFASTLASVSGTMQLALASHDLLVILDEDLRLMEFVRSTPALLHNFKRGTHESLLSMCVNDEHRNRLLKAARCADTARPWEPSQKCMVTFLLSSGTGEMFTECLVSKCIQGQRMVGITVTNLQGSFFRKDVLEEYTRMEESISQVGKQSQTSLRSPPHKALSLALHNCTEVFQLSSSVSTMLQEVLLQAILPSALAIYDRRESEAAIVAASACFESFFPSLSLPAPLSSLLRSEATRRVCIASELPDVCVYEQETRLDNGLTVSV